VDDEFSMFNTKSTVSSLNRGECPILSERFLKVYALAKDVNKKTDGAFDITVAPLVNAWGFGLKKDLHPDSVAVDSLLRFVGMDCIDLSAGHGIPAHFQLDFSAIAKGYGCDVIARLLRHHSIQNFMVEIGGEVVVSGKNPKGEAWHIGVNKPDDDPTSSNRELETVLTLDNQALATSGNYRNFYVTDEGRRVAHTIDPHTGYPVQHSLLSATVLAPNCATADAFATAFMVLGIDRAKEVLVRHPELEVYFIYDSLGEHRVFSTIE
jgi:thiamine biosynthesis lipoprotein